MKTNLKALHVLPMSVVAVLLCLATLTGCSGATDIADYLLSDESAPYDPSKDVSISDFVPKSGGVGQQLVIKGQNFGNDTSIVKVLIGGKVAPLVKVKGENLYCFIPSGAYSGVVEVEVGKGSQEQTATASEKFNYERKMVVGTLCGYKNERDDQGWSESGSSFETVTGFRNDGVMKFSPYNHNQLFVVYDQEPYFDGQHSIQLIDLEKRVVTDVLSPSMFGNQRLRTIDFATDPYAYSEDGTLLQTGEKLDEDPESPTYGQTIPTFFGDDAWFSTATPDQKKWREHLIVTVDAYNDQFMAPAVHIVDRDQNGEFSSSSPHRLIAAYNQCNGAAVHPINGELYFNSYTKGEMLRLDMNKYWETLLPTYTGPIWDANAINNFYDATTGTSNGSGAFQLLYKIQDNGFECQIDIHPEGNYAYIVVINKEYILKTDYNATTKRFTAPYQIAGSLGARGNTDGVGKSALLARPYQGTFAVNDQYKKEGRADVYDFFFCDSGVLNEGDMGNVDKFGSTIRCLTPQGIVSTYAGGGSSTHSDGKVHGNENGELRDVARFYRPTGLVSDLNYDLLDSDGNPTRIFYILDTMNRQIRTIGYENETTETQTGTETSTEGTGN